jgi:hypothetical protein
MSGRIAGYGCRMGYQTLVAVILTVHFLYLGYVVLGGFLAWRWPAAFWPHLASAIWGVLIVTNRVNCPLTWAEMWARGRAGDAPVNGGFIDRYVTDVIYPGRFLVEVRVLVALAIAISWAGAYTRWRSRLRRVKDTESKSAGDQGRAATV